MEGIKLLLNTHLTCNNNLYFSCLFRTKKYYINVYENIKCENNKNNISLRRKGYYGQPNEILCRVSQHNPAIDVEIIGSLLKKEVSQHNPAIDVEIIVSLLRTEVHRLHSVDCH